MLLINGPAALKEHEGRELGVGSAIEVTQQMIDRFADLTGDAQWIHVDAERARRGPFGTTIAHGFLTLSLLPRLTDDVYRVEGFRMAINYGLNHVRFPAPTPAGSRLRAAVGLASVEEVDGGLQAEFVVTMTVEGADKPSCVASSIARYYS